MVYEPSGDLRRVARLLKPGDSIRVSGGVRRSSSKNPVVVNVEKIDVLNVSRDTVKGNPRCVACGSGMKSEGRGKGYECKKCGHRSAEPAEAKAERQDGGQTNLRRHLSSVPASAEAPDETAHPLRKRTNWLAAPYRGLDAAAVGLEFELLQMPLRGAVARKA